MWMPRNAMSAMRCNGCPKTVANHQRRELRTQPSRDGAASILCVFLMFALVAIMAMTLDLNNISIARSELQRSADASALAACWELYDQKILSSPAEDLTYNVQQSAESVAANNEVGGESPSVSYQHSDIMIGEWSVDDTEIQATNDESRFNAVRVTLRREVDVNGQVPLHFARVLGIEGQSLRSSSTAVLLRSVRGFSLPPDTEQTLDILPIALDLQTWNQVLAGTTSDSFRIVNGQVVSGSDGISECSLYPEGTGAPGNRGTVDIGGSNNSTNDISRQILTGISIQDLEDLGRPLTFDEQGYLDLNGDTGLSAGIKDELASIVGRRRIIPIYESVSGNGNNAVYRIVRFEGVTILSVKLTGSPKQKHVTIQPSPMLARGAVIVEGQSAESDYLFTPVVLVD